MSSELAASPVPVRLRRSARRAYESARAQSAVRRGTLAALLMVPGFSACGATTSAALCMAGLALAVAAGRFRGGAWERGSRAGAIAGVAPCLAPAVLRLFGSTVCAATSHGIPWPCLAGGLAAGAVLAAGKFVAPVHGERVPFWTAAFVSLACASAICCLPAGAIGFGALAAGMVAGGVPVLAVRRATS